MVLLILSHGHQIVFRAPYWPVDGPIEYVFNVIEQALTRRMYAIRDSNDLLAAIHEIIRAIPNFVNWFHHVGYR